MIQLVIEVGLPIFLIILGGYCTVKFGILTRIEIHGLLKFTQKIAIPVFLFLSMLKLNLSEIFNWKLLFSYYFGAVVCFLIGIVVSKLYLKCSTSESIVISFGILFSNAVLLGLPISTLAFGKESIGSNLAIISINAPFCYLIGISLMGFTDAKNQNLLQVGANIFSTIISNNITVGLVLGLLFNLIGIQVLLPVYKAFDLISVGSVSIALFALGGVIVDYNLSTNFKKIVLVVILSLMVHPLLTSTVGKFNFHLSSEVLRGAIITASMGPGINAFIFASIYKKEMEVIAGAVLLCTPLSIFATLIWMPLI